MEVVHAYSARLVYIWVYKDLAIDRRGTLWKILKKGRAIDPIWGFCNWSAIKGMWFRSFLQYTNRLLSRLANHTSHAHALAPMSDSLVSTMDKTARRIVFANPPGITLENTLNPSPFHPEPIPRILEDRGQVLPHRLNKGTWQQTNIIRQLALHHILCARLHRRLCRAAGLEVLRPVGPSLRRRRKGPALLLRRAGGEGLGDQGGRAGIGEYAARRKTQ